MNRIFRLLLLCIAIFAKTDSKAQVTIGTTEASAQGAILQLKNIGGITNGAANANRGLALPRVQLISPTELYPMFTDSDPKYDTAAKKEAQKKAHEGLLVYVPVLFSDNYCPGLYVWDGTRWTPFQKRVASDQATFVDSEGNTYTYAKFGSQYWTTQNIRTTTVNGEGITLLANETTAYNATKQSMNKLVINLGLKYDWNFESTFVFETKQDILDFGMHKYIMNEDELDITLDDFVTKFGILYSYAQALKACPTGWRLPSKAKFDAMYLEVQRLTGLDANSAGKAMKNDQSVYQTLEDGERPNWDGVDLCSSEAINTGFNALPAGAIDEVGRSVTFGSSAYWWFDNLQGLDYLEKYERYALRDNRTILSTTGENLTPLNPNIGMHYSVRCVKDVE